MSNSSKPILLYLIVLLVTIASLVITIVVLKISYEQMLMKKDKSEKELIIAGQEQRRLNAVYQDLVTEEHIIPFAEKELFLIRNFNNKEQIKISKDKLKRIEEVLLKKYE